MQTDVFNIAGEKIDETELPDAIFGLEPNVAVMHQALVRQLANVRQGTHSTRTRGEVQGTTAKWYRQKGTGRARHGDRKAPIFVHGGVAHGPKPRDYTKRMPRKMRRLALKSALSAKAAEGQIVVVDEIDFERPRTRQMVDALEALGVAEAVILMPERNFNVEKSANNLFYVKTLRAQYLNVRDLLKYEHVIIPLRSLEIISEILGE